MKTPLTLIKYIIYDKCIDIAFERFINNILIPQVSDHRRLSRVELLRKWGLIIDSANLPSNAKEDIATILNNQAPLRDRIS